MPICRRYGTSLSAGTWSPRSRNSEKIEKLLGDSHVYVIRESGGKYLVSNQPVAQNAHLAAGA